MDFAYPDGSGGDAAAPGDRRVSEKVELGGKGRGERKPHLRAALRPRDARARTPCTRRHDKVHGAEHQNHGDADGNRQISEITEYTDAKRRTLVDYRVRRFLWHFSLTYVILRIILKAVEREEKNYAALTPGNDKAFKEERF